MNVRVDICCNDPDNGIFDGRAAAIQLGGDGLLELAAKNFEGPRLTLLDGLDRIRIAGKHWPITATRDYIGNWCWNGYWMRPAVAVDFLTWLHGRHIFSVEQAEEWIFNMWMNPAPFSADDRRFLATFVQRAALEQRGRG
jgi:hypothetical protein